MKQSTTHFARKSAVFALALCSALFGIRSARASQPPDFSGKWQLNRDKSDDPRTKIREAMSNGGGFGHRGMGGGGMGGGGWPGRQGGGYGTPPFGGGSTPGGSTQGGQPQTGSNDDSSQTGQSGGSNRQQRRGNLAVLLNTPEVLTITHKEPSLTINEVLQDQDQPQERNIFTDGRSMDSKDSSGQSQQSTAKWKGKKLVIETKNDRGTITETYELTSGGKVLEVNTKVEGGRMNRTVNVKRIYDVEKPDATKTAAPKS